MEPPTTPAQAWRALRQGNDRFVRGQRIHPHQDADHRSQLAKGQQPFAVVFGCSDSRVAAEIVFDRGLGDLFVVRTAGHVIDSGVLGTIEFGVTVLQTPLIVVLGHDACGAIQATLRADATGEMPGGFVRDVVERVMPSLLTARRGGPLIDDPDGLDELVNQHVRHTVDLIVERSPAIAERVRAGSCGLVGLEYRLAEGRVHPVCHLGAIEVEQPGVEAPG